MNLAIRECIWLLLKGIKLPYRISSDKNTNLIEGSLRYQVQSIIQKESIRTETSQVGEKMQYQLSKEIYHEEFVYVIRFRF